MDLSSIAKKFTIQDVQLSLSQNAKKMVFTFCDEAFHFYHGSWLKVLEVSLSF